MALAVVQPSSYQSSSINRRALP